jgi:hypothetical protein
MTEEKLSTQDNKVIAAGSSIYGISAAGLYLPRIFKHHLDTGAPLDVKHASGTLSIPIEDLIKYLEESGGKRGVCQYDGGEYNYLWNPSYISISFTKKSNAVSVTGYLMEEKLLVLFKHIEDNFISKSKKDLVFSIVKSSFGLEIKNLGSGSSPLIEENYNPEVISDLKHVVEAFNKSPPSGRICILNGEPGTGKTHLARSFLSELDCVFLIVPSNLIASLDSPEFLPLLLRVKDSHEKPIILIIEDGDTCLVPRKSDNMSTITSLLNLSDGILGAIMDIKMIVTTNAEIRDVDQAIMRPGRLCKNINVGPLPYELANNVYRRLMTNQEASLEKKRFYTLAEIYDVFNNKDNPKGIAASKPKTIGFRSSLGFAMPSKVEESQIRLDRLMNEIQSLEEIAKKKGLL